MAKFESHLNLLPPLEEGLKLLRTPEPPYYAVIGCCIMEDGDDDEFHKQMKILREMAQNLEGFLGMEVGLDKTDDGRVFKLSAIYWKSLEAIEAWRKNEAHMRSKIEGKKHWYAEHNVRVCHVLSQYGSNLNQKKSHSLAYNLPKPSST